MFDADDIAQSAVLSMLERGASGGTWTPMAIRSAVQLHASAVKPEDAEARMLLDVQVESRQRKLGRDLTAGEIEMIAVLIIDGWAGPRRPPGADFHVDYELLSLSDASVLREANALPAPAPGDESEDWLEDEFEAGVLTIEQVRKKAWNHFSADFGLPRVPDGLVSSDAAAAARNDIAARGGLVTVALGIVADGDNGNWSDPLFSPWPFASFEQRKLIAEFMTAQIYAGGLWESAMDTATSSWDGPTPIDMTDPPEFTFVGSDEVGVLGHLFWGEEE